MVPGDRVFELPDAGVVRVGAGLREHDAALVATRPGVLLAGRGGKLWVLGRQGRYIPALDDPVLGVVVSRGGEWHEVDIGAPFPAILPALAFEGATRRNRPDLRPGDLVYCRVDMADRDLQPTVTCVDAAGRGAGFGPLKGGYVVEVGSAYARLLLAQPPPAALAALGAALRFELAVGVNGRVWVAAPTPAATTAVAAALAACERETPERAEAVVAAVVKAHKRRGSGGGGGDAMQE